MDQLQDTKQRIAASAIPMKAKKVIEKCHKFYLAQVSIGMPAVAFTLSKHCRTATEAENLAKQFVENMRNSANEPSQEETSDSQGRGMDGIGGQGN